MTAPIALSEQAKHGFGWAWGEDGISVQTRSGQTLAIPETVRDETLMLKRRMAPAPQAEIEQRNGQITWNGVAITPANTQCWLPRVAGQNLVAECWPGLYAYHHVSGEGWWLGKGHRPLWLADGNSLVFERTWDDGTHLLGSDVYWYDWHMRREVNLSAEIDDMVRRPSVSADGQWLAVDIEQNLYLAPLRWEAQP